MSDVTSIQWADTTVNPIMGCGGCELFPAPGQILDSIDRAVSEVGGRVSSREIYKDLVNRTYEAIEQPREGHFNTVNTTNIWHLREQFLEQVLKDAGKEAAVAAERAIKQSITCYAATLHLNKGQKITKPFQPGHKGHAFIFESIRHFPRKCMDTAGLKDLLGHCNPKTPWKDRLCRLIFVSDMGDALSSKKDFEFLKSDLMPAVTSKAGKRHLWLWLTKRPKRMAEFAEKIGGLPENMCAMSTLTGSDEENLKRLEDLKTVKAKMRGLSIEPLWERIPPSKLDLTGIDWVIVGGESGSGLKFTRPFALEWAEEIRDHCRTHGVAFFMKQLGRNPSRNGEVFKLRDGHGGNWDEWPDDALKVREFPVAFHEYRRDELKDSNELRPVKGKKKKKGVDNSNPADVGKSDAIQPSKNDSGKNTKVDLINDAKAEFERLHEIVSKGVKGFVEAGEALSQIHERKLWQAGGFETWAEYCRSVAGISRVHAHRLMQASECVAYLKSIDGISIFPVSESQVRPLLRLTDSGDRHTAWNVACETIFEEGKQPTAGEVRKAVEYVISDKESEHKTVQKQPTRTEKRAELFSKLRSVIKEGKSWEDVEKLLAELEKLI